MILQALDGYYHRLARRDEPPVPTYGYSDQPILFELLLSESGTLLDANPLGSQGKRKVEPRRLPVPAPVIRTSGIASNFLWDKSAYVLGLKHDPKVKAKIVESPREHEAFCALQRELIGSALDLGLRAVLAFLDGWSPADFERLIRSPDVIDTNLVFRLDGELGFVHARPAAQDIWARHLAGKSGADGLCLVTGETAPVARLHPPIKGVRDAQSSGASMVSFNLDAFSSLGKEQGLNAPVSERAAFAYGTALNHLLRGGTQNRQRLQIADATTVFWAEAGPDGEEAASEAERVVGWFVDPPSEELLDEDQQTRVRMILEQVAQGRPLADVDPKLDEGTRLFVLGLAPNAARLSVRFWHVDTLGVLAQRFHRHWQDLRIEPCPWKRAPAIWRLLYETAAQRKPENVPPNLGGEVMRAILSGTHYPQTLFASVIARCRADRDLNGMRAAILKACLVRRKESVPVSLDVHETNPGYRLGRLFAVLEGIQRAALGKVNASIRDRFYGAASATPGAVFPILLRTAGHHLSNVRKSDKTRLAGWFEKELGAIMDGLGTSLPHNLSIRDQGRFAIGYYHQRYGRRSDAPVELQTAVDIDPTADVED